jgi:alpha-glucosidase
MYYHQEIANGVPPEEALRRAAKDTRDRCRTPFQWDATPNAGFSPVGVRTWLPVNPNFADGVTVADQQNDPSSMLNFYKDMLCTRKESPALISGDYQALHETSNEYLAFLRRSDSPQQTCLVVLNLSDQTHQIDFELPASNARCIFSTQKPKNALLSLNDLEVTPFEILIAELHSAA